MPIFRISELQNGRDVVAPINIATASLRDAKISASNTRAIKGTELVIRNEQNVMIAVKRPDADKWIDCYEMREGDERVCTCGLRWDNNEEDPHHV